MNIDSRNLVCAMLLNSQSLASKDDMLKQFMIANDISLCIVTETWISADDTPFIEGTCLSWDGWQSQFSPRLNRHGGGLALFCKDYYKVEKIKDVTTCLTFEACVWKITAGKCQFYIMAVYRHPTKPGMTIQYFIDEFLDFIEQDIMFFHHFILLGDFNIPLNDLQDIDVQIYKETFKALGLDQHVSFMTQNKGNILDHIYVPHRSKLRIIKLTQGPFLSDHCAILFTISVHLP